MMKIQSSDKQNPMEISTSKLEMWAKDDKRQKAAVELQYLENDKKTNHELHYEGLRLTIRY